MRQLAALLLATFVLSLSCSGRVGQVSPVCGNEVCEGTETCASCAADCGACPEVVCGDGACGQGETCASCAADCGACPEPVCGDGACGQGETCATCAADCGACPVPVCGDGTCQGGETCATCAADCGGPCPGAVVRGPYLQLGTPSSVIVRWRTDAPTGSVVRYGTSLWNLGLQASVVGSQSEHEVRLGDLSPNTRYYYSIGDGASVLAGGDVTHTFVTAPAPGTSKPTRIWILGDSGTANSSARAVKNAFLANSGTRAPDVWVMLGDNAYPDGTDSEYQAAVFDMYPEILRKVVLWPTLGNHDGHSTDSATQSGPYYDIFTLPKNGEAGGLASGTEAYHSFDYGDIHFINLESYQTDRSTSGAMMTWLENDLLANTKPWVIAFWHHPPYSKGSHDSDTSTTMRQMRENALPILEAHGVDAIFTGHSHSYERSFFLHGHYGRSDTLTGAMILDSGDGRVSGTGAYTRAPSSNKGAVYVVAGSSGKVSAAPLDHPAMYLGLLTLGSVVVDVEGNRLEAVFLDSTGEVRDSYTIVK